MGRRDGRGRARRERTSLERSNRVAGLQSLGAVSQAMRAALLLKPVELRMRARTRRLSQSLCGPSSTLRVAEACDRSSSKGAASWTSTGGRLSTSGSERLSRHAQLGEHHAA
jgi:hypothetical protein